MLEETKEFGSLIFPQKRVVVDELGDVPGYRVYFDEERFKVVEAETATEAIEKSEVEEPVKVERISVSMQNIIDSADIRAVEGESGEDAEATEENQEAVASEE